MASVKLITAEDIRKLRKIVGLTQKELSKKAGVSQSLIARIENRTVDPRLSTVKKIIEAMVSLQEEKTIEDIMHNPVITVEYMDSIRKAIELMKKNDISQIPVLKGLKIVGSIQESTLIDKIVRSSNPEKILSAPIYNVMEKRFELVETNTSITDVLNLFFHGEPAVLVIKKEKIIGIITKIDVLSSIISFKK